MTLVPAVLYSRANPVFVDCGATPGFFPDTAHIRENSVSISSDSSKRAVCDGKRFRLIALFGWCDWLDTLAKMGSSERFPGTNGRLVVNVLPNRRDVPND